LHARRKTRSFFSLSRVISSETVDYFLALGFGFFF
jgi:hypothetical protein